ncbi:SDR family oxidoreductase [Aestuariibacter halophilus]|uniref:SDR family oxidoreductase n=1 Tax=Fluctibacter halophilus TaxID=226011 RepID=A0ABS8G4S5_9ALTE|nr:SDR family NAD(P)-dependent oxidoreductase [Aestuariibacter halophilus]MCC2615111.1 SDR family oxidoreductase [Aestuariibacter halophilus]
MLADHYILVTGANRGIGLATASVCVALGATVFLAGRDEEGLQGVAALLGERAVPMCYDLTDEDEVKAAFGHIQTHVGKLDGLVNNAGAMLDRPLAMTRLSELRELLDINTVAAYQHAQLAARLMSRERNGVIVNVSSVVGEQGSAGQSAYATSKAALSGMTKALAKELAPLNIRVNGVAPGFIDTDLTAAYQDDKRDAVLQRIGLGRVGESKEVADLISFLLSPHASYITGQIIGIDGGMTP